MEKMPRYAIFNDAYPCSMIVIQSFDINHVLWATVDIFSWAAWTETFEQRCTSVRPSIRQRQSQGSFLVWAQPVRNDIILQRLLLQAESMPKMIPVYPMSFIPLLILWLPIYSTGGSQSPIMASLKIWRLNCKQ